MTLSPTCRINVDEVYYTKWERRRKLKIAGKCCVTVTADAAKEWKKDDGLLAKRFAKMRSRRTTFRTFHRTDDVS
jgi:hypothetical protein